MRELRLDKPVPITEQIWPEGTEPVVSVFNWVYNHADFVRQSIDSILMQETTFPVEIIIHDDASNDGTTDLVREYQSRHPHLFRNVIRDTNAWSTGRSVMSPMITKTRGTFIATTHGDDYWTCRYKLHKQLKVFDDHKDILICGAPCQVLDSETKRATETTPLPCRDVQFIKAANYFPGSSTSPWIHTCTRLIPKYALVGIPEEFMIDTLMLHWLVTKYPNHFIAYIPEVAAVYRLHGNGVWSAMSATNKTNALLSIYRRASTLYKGPRKQLLLEKACEQADIARKRLDFSPWSFVKISAQYWRLKWRVATSRFISRLRAKIPTVSK
jgi:hypothetical protein